MAGEIAAAAITAGAGLMGNIFQGGMSSHHMRVAKRQQMELMQRQAEINEDLAVRMMERENAYNNPLAVMKRELAAGINPWVTAAEQGAGKSAVAQGDTPTTAVPSSPMSVSAQIPNLMSGVSSSIGDIAGAIANISQAKKNDSETKYNLESLFDRLRQQTAFADSAEAQATLNNFEVTCQALTKIPMAQTALRKMQEEVTNLIVERGNIAADTLLKQAETDLTKVKEKLTGKELVQFERLMPLVLQQYKETIGLLQQQQKTEQTKQFANNASGQASLSEAAYKGALKATEDATRQFKVSIFESQSSQEKTKAFVDSATKLIKVAQETNAAQKTVAEMEKLKQEGERLAKENKWYDLNQTFDKLERVYQDYLKTVETGAKVIGEIVPF